MESLRIELPSLRILARHAVPNIVEGTLVPLVVFLVALRLLGPGGAMACGLVWSYANVGRRLLTRSPVPGLVVLGTATITARTLVSVLSGSVFVYFLQPSLGTALVASAFLLSVPLGTPLAQRLARDFCPFPPEVLANHHVRRFFVQITILWAFTQFLNAALTIWLLVSQSLATFMVAKAAVSWTLTVSAIALSTFWFQRSMRHHGITLHWPRRVAA